MNEFNPEDFDCYGIYFTKPGYIGEQTAEFSLNDNTNYVGIINEYLQKNVLGNVNDYLKVVRVGGYDHNPEHRAIIELDGHTSIVQKYTTKKKIKQLVCQKYCEKEWN